MNKSNKQKQLKMEITQINLIAENGVTFKFANHWNADADFYQSLVLFESNNYSILGTTSYEVITKFEDGIQTKTKVDGMNASAHLAAFFCEETADELNAIYQANY